MTSPNGGRAPAPAAALPDPGRAGRAGWWAALGLALVICGALLASAGRTSLWDRDEPRFAQATVEMIGAGNYLVPTLNGRLRPDKPALVYWLMSLPMRWLGPTALAARACSAVAVALAALFTFGVARRLLPAPAGLWAMAVLAATPLALAEGQAATADAVLLAAVAAALACFAAALDGAGDAGDVGDVGDVGAAGGRGGPGGPGGPGGWPCWLGLGVALGLAQLAKGPVGLALPGLGIAATLWLLRRPAAETAVLGNHGAAPAPGGSAALAWRAALAGLLGVALFCAWGVPANRASGGELARLGLGRHVLGRALGAMEGHGGGGPLAGIPYYVLVVWVGFAPWSLYLPAAISAALGGRLGGRRGRALLIGWTAPALLLMAVVATRLPNYILPVWPLLALAVAGTLEAERRGGLSPRDRRWLRRGAWPLAALLALVLLGALALAAVVIDGSHGSHGSHGRRSPAAAPVAAAALARDLLPPVLAVAAVILAAGGAALREHLAGRFRRSALLHLGGLVGAAAVAGVLLAPVLERWKPAPRLAAAVRAAAAPGEPVATYGYGEPSLTFYLRRGTVSELGDAAAVAAWCRVAAPGILVLPRSAFGDLRSVAAVANLREVAAASGFNIAKGRLLELVALERSGRLGA
jgi:4-amino-4-deoxy-L-arabinose transferase-like glycosyltransferase